MKLRVTRSSSRSGFTLIEVAVALFIVSLVLTMLVEGLGLTKLSAYNTYNLRAARDLATLTLGRIEAGLYQDEIEDGFAGTYAEEGYEEFSFEIRLGDEVFEEMEEGVEEPGAYFDRWKDREERAEEDEDEETVEEAFEKVKIRITFPKVTSFRNWLIMECWMPWEQVYGSDEEDEEAAR